MPRLYMMVGLPGSGKSYHASTMEAVVVSSDSIREELFGDVNDQEHNNEVFNEVHKRIHENLKNGSDVVYDATNLSRKRRKAFLNTLPPGTLKYAIVMCTEYELCLENNKNRERFVPEDVIERMYRRMTIPNNEEGFDRISIVRNPNNKMTIFDYMKRCENFDQDNPHHSLTLMEHMTEAGKNMEKLLKGSQFSDIEKSIGIRAAISHDIGKTVCKTYETYSGKIDDHAHYYNHAEVGAYMILCSVPDIPITIPIQRTRDWFDKVSIAFLVQNHMRFFEDGFEPDKLKETYGYININLLKLLHEADVNAH